MAGWMGMARVGARARVSAAAAALAWAMALASACGTDAVGVQACRQVEEARCQRAPGCGISIAPPYQTAGGDVSACVRFYDDACLHGLSGSDPGVTDLHACVDAITNGTCAGVAHPENLVSCAWLVPPATGTDAASDVVEAGSDGGE
jgi:hypothetical protein